MDYRDMENALLIACTVWGLRFKRLAKVPGTGHEPL